MVVFVRKYPSFVRVMTLLLLLLLLCNVDLIMFHEILLSDYFGAV